MSENAFIALFFGLLSAFSLPLGAMTTLIWRPGPKWSAFLMSFGGGTLLAALTIDLVGESVKKGEFLPTAIGCIAGGVLFELLNQALNSKGAFLRKPSTSINYLREKKFRRYRELFRKLSRIPLFAHMPPEEVRSLVPYINSEIYAPGSILCRQGEMGTSLFIIEKGQVDIQDEKKKKTIATLEENDVLGEIALVTGEKRTATARSHGESVVWVIQKDDFDKALRTSPLLAGAIKELVRGRLENLKKLRTLDPAKADTWARTAAKNINEKFMYPTDTEINQEAAKSGGAPLAIWLGILLDGIPESLVIGASMVHSSLSMSLIAGLFLSNYPEALSSSQGMREQGSSFRKIFWMWASLMIITGAGAFLGNIVFEGVSAFTFHFVEGMAAGAMLTMIAETMLPEAFHKGGSITGLSTLMGFLTAISFKMLD